MGEWQPIETCPKKIVSRDDNSRYGKWVLVYPFYGCVVVARWWQWHKRDADGTLACNFLEAGGNPVHPTHWMPLPKPPKPEPPQ
jgi:hypothetical protein